MRPQSCPFCPYFDPSPYILAQHVETVHPEDGEPPFVSRHFLEEEDLPGKYERAMTVGEAPSQDYIQCECGEAIAASDFEDHAQLHTAEAADTAADLAEIVERPSLSTQGHATGLNLAAGSVEPTDPIVMSIDSTGNHLSAKSSKSRQASQGVNQGSQPTAKDRIALLLGPKVSRKNSDITKHKNAKRLGKAELGPYAHEDRMPAWLQRQLERGAKVSIVNKISHEGQMVRLEIVANETRGVLPVLAQLCEQDNMLAKVYLCHPGVQHVFKLAKEGGFCGYRNIQMMISYVQAAQSRGHEFFPGRIPSVLDLQELIESAWDRGINTTGKVETGGILGTRKYIGTPETLLISLNIGYCVGYLEVSPLANTAPSCEATAFNDTGNLPAHKQVYQHVEQHFSNNAIFKAGKVCKTSSAPIYFQHQGTTLYSCSSRNIRVGYYPSGARLPELGGYGRALGTILPNIVLTPVGHSLTIVGLEIRKSGSRNLLVFDPSFKPSPGIQRLIGTKFRSPAPDVLLKAYRRGDSSLGKHSSFELLK
ncbi:MAG: hypothetical protein Q9209_007967 [Squamulea sp. 1 TL-2023]